MIVRRLLIALAVLIALTAIAAGVSPPPREDSGDTPQAVADTPPGEEIDRTLSIDAKGDARIVKATVGDMLHLTVEGDAVDSVEVGEFEVAPLDPESPAIIELLAEEPGSYPIRLLDADRDVGTLEISE